MAPARKKAESGWEIQSTGLNVKQAQRNPILISESVNEKRPLM